VTLIRNKNLIEQTFLAWLSQFSDSTHPCDMEQFYVFAKTVCENHTHKWKNTGYLKKRILQKMPHFDPDILADTLDLFAKLLAFYKTYSLPAWESIPSKDYRKVKIGYYIERWAENGEIKEKYLPINDVL